MQHVVAFDACYIFLANEFSFHHLARTEACQRKEYGRRFRDCYLISDALLDHGSPKWLGVHSRLIVSGLPYIYIYLELC